MAKIFEKRYFLKDLKILNLVVATTLIMSNYYDLFVVVVTKFDYITKTSQKNYCYHTEQLDPDKVPKQKISLPFKDFQMAKGCCRIYPG